MFLASLVVSGTLGFLMGIVTVMQVRDTGTSFCDRWKQPLQLLHAPLD